MLDRHTHQRVRGKNSHHHQPFWQHLPSADETLCRIRLYISCDALERRPSAHCHRQVSVRRAVKRRGVVHMKERALLVHAFVAGYVCSCTHTYATATKDFHLLTQHACLHAHTCRARYDFDGARQMDVQTKKFLTLQQRMHACIRT